MKIVVYLASILLILATGTITCFAIIYGTIPLISYIISNAVIILLTIALDIVIYCYTKE